MPSIFGPHFGIDRVPFVPDGGGFRRGLGPIDRGAGQRYQGADDDPWVKAQLEKS